MANILKVQAKGLWSHLDSIFEYSPGMTVVTGPNGVGKSTAIEIINWVSVGDREGDTFLFEIRDKETGNIIKSVKEGIAEVYLDNDVVITKKRIRNGRTIYTHSGYPDPFVQADVPECIARELGLKWYKFGDYEILLNFVSQHAGHFMLSEVPAVGAKILGVLAGTEVVDLAIGEFKKDKHAAEKDRETQKKVIESKDQDLLKYLQLDDHRTRIDLCQSLIEKVTRDRDRVIKLQELLNEYIVKHDKIKACETCINALVNVPLLQACLKGLGTLRTKAETLTKIFVNYHLVKKRIPELVQVLQKLDTVLLYTVSVSVIKDKMNLFIALQGVFYKYQSNQNILMTCEKVISKYQGLPEYEALIRSTDQMIDTYVSLCRLSPSYTVTQVTINKTGDLLNRVSNLDTISDLIVQVKTAEKLRRGFYPFGKPSLFDQYQSQTLTINLAVETVNRFNSLPVFEKVILNTRASYLQLIGLQQIKNKYGLAWLAWDNCVKELDTRLTEENRGILAVQEAWKEAGGICPWCKSVLDGHSHS